MSERARRRILAPLAWLVLLVPPVVGWAIGDVRAAVAPPVPPERGLGVVAEVSESYAGGLEVPLSYDNPFTEQVVDTVVPVFDESLRPAAGSAVDVIVDRNNPDVVVVPGDREPLWSTLAEYVWLPLIPVLVTAGRWHFAARVRRLINDAGPTFAMLGALRPARRGTGHELHLYPVDAEPDALPLCTVPLLSTDAFTASRGMLRVEVKGSPRPFGRVVARAGPSLLWPARRAVNPARVPRPRGLAEQVSPRRPDAAREPEEATAGLLDPTYLALSCAVALILLVVVAVLTGHGARTAATAYDHGARVLVEITSADPDGFTLDVTYPDLGGGQQRAVAAADWPEEYTLGRRYPAVVVPQQPGRVRMLAEPYDAVEPIIWGALPAGAAGALLLRQHIYRPLHPRRRISALHVARRGHRPQVADTHPRNDPGLTFMSVTAAVGLTLLSGVLLIGAVEAWNKTENILQRGILVTGEVTDISRGRASSVEVSYPTQDGRTVVQDTINFVGDYAIGDPIDVVYDPVHPRRMETANWGTDHFTVYVLGTLASLCGVLAIAALSCLAWMRIRKPAAPGHPATSPAT